MRSIEEQIECRERLGQYICEYLNLSKGAWAKRAGLSEGFVKNFTGELRRDTRSKIEKAYPELNIEWVLYGTGSMIIPTDKKGVIITDSQTIVGDGSLNRAGGDININVDNSSLKEEIASLKAEIGQKEKQLQEQRELINLLIEKLSQNYKVD